MTSAWPGSAYMVGVVDTALLATAVLAPEETKALRPRLKAELRAAERNMTTAACFSSIVVVG
eukprot:CAMPEP_0178722202 /NCGR_PEP_ID=MMETSP0699-20121125/24817_1 /TAXON_ID=265572 /ORGANISM="Extubocellulus spinifer, Strain CCMP396" /LENGTH=61 /DNA_ID=CAMNT_0020373059 /DNA_START=260 /DNA_END=445 /DNA_ORIENTATION=+